MLCLLSGTAFFATMKCQKTEKLLAHFYRFAQRPCREEQQMQIFFDTNNGLEISLSMCVKNKYQALRDFCICNWH